MTPERWQQVAELYHAAQPRAPHEREAFLRARCAGDEALLHEVNSLLAADAQAGDYLATPALELEARARASEQQAALAIRQFSHYEIRSLLGVGGMGEVYLAQDTSLERPVALKILPQRFTADAARLQRFTREAKAASALNHPNIITIHEIGQVTTAAGELHFIATELIEGVTLRQRLDAGGRLPWREALDVASQIATALDAAHRAGIVHRDIKPENVMVRPDGLVKVLDFGLAKLTTPATGQLVDAETGAPIPAGQTQPGMILGTLRYMSPEQARGRTVDAQTDIFSLGAVLYELLTGQPLFAGETSADVIVAVIHTELPPLHEALPDAPLELERILRQALAKDCAQRYQTSQELQRDLQALKQELSFHESAARSQSAALRLQPSASQAPVLGRLSGPMLTTLLLALLAGLSVWWWQRAKPLGAGLNLANLRSSELLNLRIRSSGGMAGISFSPTGNLVAWSFHDEEGSHLWVKQVNDGVPRQITDGLNYDRYPVWSSDEQELAFVSKRGGEQGIWSIPSLGGTPKLLKELGPRGEISLTAWSSDKQTIYFERSPNLYALQLNTGEVQPLTYFDPQRPGPKDFSLSPDEQQIVYVGLWEGKKQLLTQPLRGGAARVLVPAENDLRAPVWLSDGERIAYLAQRGGGYQLCLTWLKRAEIMRLSLGTENYYWLAVSPRGNRLVTVAQKDNANLYTCDLQSGSEQQQTTDYGLQLYPQFAPDSARLVFQVTKGLLYGDSDALWLKPLGTGASASLTEAGYDARWSPDGQTLAFLRSPGKASELWRIGADGNKKALLSKQILTGNEFSLPQSRLATNYAWAPDGSHLAYGSLKSGQSNLWRVSSDGKQDTPLTNNTDPQWLLSSPFWSADGKWLAFLATHNSEKIRQIRVAHGPQVTPVWQRQSPLRIVGWTGSNTELLVAASVTENVAKPVEIELQLLSIKGGPARQLARLPAVYLHNLALSNDGRALALVTRAAGKDQIKIFALGNRGLRELSRNQETAVYYSGLAWAPNNKTLVYSKQASWVLVSLLENL